MPGAMAPVQQFSFWLGKGFAVAKHPLTG